VGLLKLRGSGQVLDRIQDSWAAILDPLIASSATWTDPPSSSTAGGQRGQLAADTSYLYVCRGPGSWMRISWTAW